MSHKSPWRWLPGHLRPALRSETEALRGAIAALQGQMAELHDMVQSLAARAANSEAGLIALKEAMDRDERIETLRLRVEGLCAQHRWDADELRRALTALAENLPLAG